MKKWVIPLTLSCFLLGVLFVYQIRLQDSAKEKDINNTQVLVTLINNLEDEVSLRETYLGTLRKNIDDTTNTINTDQSEVSELQESTSKLRPLSGSSTVEGQGIIITLNDNINATTGDVSNNIIHYQDLLYLVNELRRANAEAISINEQRIITSSEIRCVGNTILVNTTRLAPPYEIKAIGNSKKLIENFTNCDTYNKLYTAGFPISYKEYNLTNSDLIQIPGYTGNYTINKLEIIEQ